VCVCVRAHVCLEEAILSEERTTDEDKKKIIEGIVVLNSRYIYIYIYIFND